MQTIDQLEMRLSEPSEELKQEITKIKGDILILGVGGKMGPSLAKLAKRAIDAAGQTNKVIGVSRFGRDNGLRQELEDCGIETIGADLLDQEQVNNLPAAENVIYMAGQKFGTTGKEPFTWAMNTMVPSFVGKKFSDSRIVVFSSGNVYPFTPVNAGGADEGTTAEPVGEYAQSCLGRERIFQYYSAQFGTKVLIFRLNYAIDMRYGVLLDIATAVKQGTPIDLSMGNVNVIWQGDANSYAIRALPLCNSPARILNVTGPETVSVRWLATEFAKAFGVTAQFTGIETDVALLNNASLSHHTFGYPKVTLQDMLHWTVEWVQSGGVTLGKPTHFQEREGKF